jgi:hypothetical protein
MKTTYVLIPAVILLASGPGFASTIVQTQEDTLLDVENEFVAPVAFNQFDASLGVLNSITLSLAASFAGTVGVENLSSVPDVAAGIIAGTVTVATNGDTLSVEVFPSAVGPTHHLTAFDGTLDYAGTSGATDSVSGAMVTGSVTGPPPDSVLQLFTGSNDIFLTLTATSFPLVEGMETESVTETANATARVTLAYDYTPVPDPGMLPLLAAGLAGLAWIRHRRAGRS